MIYKFNYNKDFIKSISKTKNKNLFLSLSYSLGFSGITIAIILNFIIHNHYFPIDNNFSTSIFIEILGFFILFFLCFNFHFKLFNKIIDKSLFVDNIEQFIKFDKDYMIIYNKNMEQKICFNDIISTLFTDEFVTIKTKDSKLFIPTNFENGEIFSELLIQCLDN